MFATLLSSTSTIQANQPIVLNEEPFIKSNDNVELNENNDGLIIKKPGLYKLRFQANLFTIIPSSASIGNSGVTLYVNGEKVNETEYVLSFSESTSTEIILEYPLNIAKSDDSEYVEVQFHSYADATLKNGLVSAERVS